MIRSPSPQSVRSENAGVMEPGEVIRARLGDRQPIVADARRRPSPRAVSRRWLAGTALTGLTGAVLLGGALQVAQVQTVAPASVADADLRASAGEALNYAVARLGNRPLREIAAPASRVMRVPVVLQDGSAEIVRKMPFGFGSRSLAATTSRTYRAFDALEVFAPGKAAAAKGAAPQEALYDVDIDTDMIVKLEPFGYDRPFRSGELSLVAARAAVNTFIDRQRSQDVGGTDVAAPTALDGFNAGFDPSLVMAMMVEAENVSRVEKASDPLFEAPRSGETLMQIDTASDAAVVDALAAFDGREAFAAALADAAKKTGGETTLRVAYHADERIGRQAVRRVSVYRDGEHVRSVVAQPDGSVVSGREPVPMQASVKDTTRSAQTSWSDNLKTGAERQTVYDGIMSSGLAQGLSEEQTRGLVRAFAFHVDLRARVRTSDSLDIFYSLAPGSDRPSDASRILFAGLKFGDTDLRYYAHTDADGTTGWYDESGRSARQFLLRKPLAGGRFTSGYGLRRHPIARYRKMHTGVDWAAPSGTRILAAGNGKVIKAGWAGGYGRQIKIAHANGYVTSYSHLRAYGKGIREGARVRQGQMIGQVGTSGASTGPHLHYEVIVNRKKVNPMRIRLPKGRSLSGVELARFERERVRIDALVERARDMGLGRREVASR